MEPVRYRVTRPLEVITGDEGHVGAWITDGDRPVGLVFDPWVADETGLRLRMAARDTQITPPLPQGEVVEVGFTPPIDALAYGLLSMTFADGRRLTAAAGLSVLQQFSDAAAAALAAVPPASRS